MEWLAQIRYSLRALRRRPGFALTAIAVVALGIGTNAAVFRMVNAVLIRPLPFAEPDQLVRIYLVPEAGLPRISLRPESFLAIRERASGFAGMAAQRLTPMVLRSEGSPAERVNGIAVSEGWDELLGVRPRLGRTFSAEEEAHGEASGVVLLSDGFWRRRFGADDAVVGRSIVLDAAPRTIIGVLPPGFSFPYRADFWMPMRLEGPQGGSWGLNAPARLRPGVQLATVQEDLRRISPELETLLPQIHRGMTVIAVPLRETLLEGYDRILAGLLVAVGFLSLLVAANVAGLLLVRLEERGLEFAVRAALGGGASRLLAPLFLEAALVVGLGGLLGLAGAAAAGPLLQPLVPDAMTDVLTGSSVDGRVAAFTFVLVLLVSLGVALPAAWNASRRDPGAALYGGSRAGGRPRRLMGQRILAASEVALALGLAIGAGALLRDVARRLDAGPGYAGPERIQTFRLSLGGPVFASTAARIATVDSIVERLGSLPGVDSVAATTIFPSGGGNQLANLEIEGLSEVDGERRLANHRLVTPDFLATLGLRALHGRLLSERDTAEASPVAVVSQALARRAFGDDDPIGKRLRDRRDPTGRWLEIVGVVPDVREFYDVPDTWYLPYAQHADSRAATLVTFALRAEPLPTLESLGAAVSSVDPGLAIADLATAAALLEESVGGSRAASRFAGFFASFGLGLAVFGLYGTVAQAVATRRREIGLRVALGASRHRIVALFLRQGLVTAAAGSVGGLLLGAVGGRWLLSAAGTGEGAVETSGIVLAVLVVAAAVVAATLWPAWRALRVDPGSALRAD